MRIVVLWEVGDRVVTLDDLHVGVVTEVIVNFIGGRWYWVDDVGPYSGKDLKAAKQPSDKPRRL